MNINLQYKIKIIFFLILFCFQGCADSLAQEIEGHLKIIGAVGLGISPVQIIGMILSCCLYVKLKKFSK